MNNKKELLTATEIQREISKKGKFITPSQIGAIAKHLNMVVKTNLGFKLYNRKVIDYIIKEKHNTASPKYRLSGPEMLKKGGI